MSDEDLTQLNYWFVEAHDLGDSSLDVSERCQNVDSRQLSL